MQTFARALWACANFLLSLSGDVIATGNGGKLLLEIDWVYNNYHSFVDLDLAMSSGALRKRRYNRAIFLLQAALIGDK
ncbi:hypothetical protein Z042_04680 [Chania multitudinisentens RB-25]|uniref:Uncharacterized protein n=1 Tax=Chania multitudinisentens RB-25 TaxID=1441930 RepID=W0LFL3_9GAMM|nr:hypothetical protein [Chania multitudinisentens]AHG22658.1 hypothetical protein Z042_04680 [Chania multitudinisentens RB-25]